jgi:hypothetical protein
MRMWQHRRWRQLGETAENVAIWVAAYGRMAWEIIATNVQAAGDIIAATVRVRARYGWRRLVICPEIAAGTMPSHLGGYPAWFCDRFRWHSGRHHDFSREATW